MPKAVTSCLGWLNWDDPVTSCLGWLSWDDPDFQGRLANSNSRCQGQLEVHLRGLWRTVCRWSWGWSPDGREDASQASKVCQRLHCGEALVLAHFPLFSRPQNQIICHGHPGSFSNCSSSSSRARQCPPLGLVCLEPQMTTPPPTSPPPTTTPEPTAPPRLQLVAVPRGLRCAGMVEFYSGSLGGTISYEAQDRTQGLGDLICAALQCGSFLKHLPEAEAATAQDPGELWNRRLLPIRWKVQNASCASLEQCFRKTQPQEGGQALALVCSDFQPKVQSRLVGGSSVCEGTVEVRQGMQWAALCDSSSAKGMTRWEEVCREQQCGGVNSYHVLDAGEKTSRGLFCPQEKLSQCHELREKKAHCKRVFVTCQDPNPAGPAAGTVASIILALLLLAVLLVVCGPLAYKKLVKKFRQKKQRQWIGPTGMNQNMSFHRNHTATVRSQVENPPVSHVDNEYSQPPRNSHVSAYPALEGALHRSSTQPDNSSDSDYDLHGAQRLSFHRNHTATVRSQVENPPVSHVDNEYSQPPRNSHVSAYPALEGALHRSSTQPDNSSDSDYDLHGAQRL
ncbi:PREDICTED: T-cell surface glycoprotein CD5-like [Galeopterus variegatus]|uniref:T-cell surface glycoprotein CD5-like n=1 Tax=Galeopterus variegatus TaxID=482537 RepID=A0ABM0SCR1_GALVR|nr:PREDICTED: T-cell surface glycoprotein CD5-like [Galeopterus variegatus]